MKTSGLVDPERQAETPTPRDDCWRLKGQIPTARRRDLDFISFHAHITSLPIAAANQLRERIPSIATTYGQRFWSERQRRPLVRKLWSRPIIQPFVRVSVLSVAISTWPPPALASLSPPFKLILW